MRIISGKFKNMKLYAPKGLETRPTSDRLREAVFNIMQHQIEDAEFLDLFAGSGAIGLEAISRGAQRVTFIDNSRESIRNIERNILEMDERKSSRVIKSDVCDALEKLKHQKESFDIIYVDPPYGLSLGDQVLRVIDDGDLLTEDGMLFIEEKKEWQPDLEGLTTIKQKSDRRVGRSRLLQFEKGGT